MKTEDTPHVEDFAQALAALKAEYQVNNSDIAHRIGVTPAAVSTWANRQRTPRRDAIEKLAEAYPKFTVQRLLAAAGRKAPGPLSQGAEERLLGLFKRLTAEQQEMKEVEMQALVERNERDRSKSS